jgi:cleavage and polyadenylation specificity factor subunit 3
MGNLAVKNPESGDKISGVLVKRDFKYHVLAAGDLSKYTDMSMSVVTQRQSLVWSGAPGNLKMLLERIGGPTTVQVLEVDKKFKVFECVDVTFDGKIVILEWQASPVNDMYADTVLASLLQTELCGSVIKGTTTAKPDKMHFKECLIEALQDMFGENSVKVMKGDSLGVNVNKNSADIDLNSLVSVAL